MFSPTIHSAANPIYNSLKYLYEVYIILDYSDHKLLETLQEIDGEKQFIEDYKEYLTVWKKYMKIECGDDLVCTSTSRNITITKTTTYNQQLTIN